MMFFSLLVPIDVKEQNKDAKVAAARRNKKPLDDEVKSRDSSGCCAHPDSVLYTFQSIGRTESPNSTPGKKPVRL
jgi:hypothetical protein